MQLGRGGRYATGRLVNPVAVSAASRQLASFLLILGLLFLAMLSFTRHIGEMGPNVQNAVQKYHREQVEQLPGVEPEENRIPTLQQQQRQQQQQVSVPATSGGRFPSVQRLSQQRPQVGKGGALLRLMMASHNRLFWYYPGTNVSEVLHDGQVRVASSSMHARRSCA